MTTYRDFKWTEFPKTMEIKEAKNIVESFVSLVGKTAGNCYLYELSKICLVKALRRSWQSGYEAGKAEYSKAANEYRTKLSELVAAQHDLEAIVNRLRNNH